MRKGILSLSMTGRNKASSKKKTKNMEQAEQTAVRKTPATDEAVKAKTQERSFVQTVQIPKQGMVPKKAKRKHSMVVVPEQTDQK